MVAPRAFACSYSSSTTTPAPSPICSICNSPGKAMLQQHLDDNDDADDYAGWPTPSPPPMPPGSRAIWSIILGAVVAGDVDTFDQEAYRAGLAAILNITADSTRGEVKVR